MPNQREARERMRAIKQTLQVTRAMNLISTAKLRRGKELLAACEPYFQRIQQTMREILAGQRDVRSEYFHRPEKRGRDALLVITSDKGLAGGYNAAMYRYSMGRCAEMETPVLVLVGNVGQRFFVRSPYMVLENFSFNARVPTLDDAHSIADYLSSQFKWGVFNSVRVVYTHMFSSMKTQPMEKRILPLDAEILKQDYITEAFLAVKAGVIDQSAIKEVEDLHFEYIPSREAVFDLLAPNYIAGVIFGCLIEAYACEQSARMSAMDEASRNGEDMYQQQLIAYNRARQQIITQEMTEIVSGSAAIST